MTQNTPTTVINVAVESRDDVLFASSEDLFGLNITAANQDELCSRLKIAVKWLFKQNRDMDVDVIIPSSPAEFPAKSHPMFDRTVVASSVALAAAA